VNVIAYRTVRAFTERFPEAEPLLRDWYNTLAKLEPQNFAELKAQFPSVDTTHQKDGTTVFIFDVGGNKYRVIVRIDFEFQATFILYVLTHKEYDLWNKRRLS
jgi:mRNA interferase HigB